MFKVLVVGDVAVGKTSLVNRIANNTFTGDYQSTITCDFAKKDLMVGNQEYTVQLWDLAGQDRMVSAMTKIFVRDAMGTIAVCDLTDQESLKRANEWKEAIRESSDKSMPFYLVASKSDLEHSITDSQLAEFAQQNQFDGAIKVSSKTGDNCELALQTLVEQIVSYRGSMKVSGQSKKDMRKQLRNTDSRKKQSKCC